MIKHDELVANPEATFANMFTELSLEEDSSPAEFIKTNLFNSSFDATTVDEKAKESFKNRLKAWDSWSNDEQSQFIDICDELMVKYKFVRPYSSDSGTEDSVDSIEEADKRESDTSDDGVSNDPSITRIHDPAFKAAVKAAYPHRINDRIRSAINGFITPIFFDYVYNVSTRFNYTFVNVPKVASTSLLSLMQLAEDPDVARSLTNIHDRAGSPLRRLLTFSPEVQEEMLYGNTYRRISFVRNPYSRVLSAYLSKVSKPLHTWKFDPDRAHVRPPKADILAVIQGKDVLDLSLIHI